MGNVVVPVNYLAVLVSAIASMMIGYLWYGPIFGKPWMKEMGMTEKDVEEGKKKGMGKSYFLMFLGSLMMAFVLAHATVFADSYLKEGQWAGPITGFWNWLGFVVPVSLGSVLWENKSLKLWMLNSGFYLVTLLMMGCILSYWR